MKNVYHLFSGKEKIFFPGIFILCMLVSQTFAQSSAQIQWQRSLGGTAWDEMGTVVQSTDGGYVMTGFTYSVDGDVTGLHDTMLNAGDIWVVKLDSAGGMLWQKCLGGSNGEWSGYILQTSDLGYAVFGETRSNDGNVSGYHGYQDGWLVKLDAGGNLQWQKCLGDSNAGVYACGFVQTPDSGFVVGGSSTGFVGNHGQYDLWMSKLDASGNVQWNKCLGGSQMDGANSIIQTNDSGYIMCGASWSNDGDVSGHHGGFTCDIWVVKTDAGGNIQWQRSYGGTADDRVWAIKQTTDGGYIFVGDVSSVDGDVTGNIYLSTPRNFWIVKIDASGNIQWQRVIDPQVMYGTRIIETTGGNFLFGGSDPFGARASMMMLDTNGNILWQTCCGGSGGMGIWTLIETSDNNFVVGGDSKANVGDLTEWHGDYDVWIMKFNPLNWISGTVYYDQNQNCVQNNGEPGEISRWLNINPPPISVHTDASGYYSAVVDTGNYTVSLTPSIVYNLNCPVSGSYSVSLSTPGTGSVNNNFADTAAMLCPELSINIATWSLRPCFLNTYSVTYCNNGTLDSYNDSIVIVFPSTVIPLSSTIPWTVVAPNTYSFIIDTLLIGQCGTFYITDSVSCGQPVGDTLCASASINALAECYYGNNTDEDCRVTTNSCDPNSKEVSVTNSSITSWVSSGNILNTDTLEYQINFQNTGTDTAWTVVILDTLSSDLDITSIEIGAVSHEPYSFSIYPPSVLAWTFYIQLLDSNVNEAASHGFVKFKIRPKSGLSSGTQIFNSAGIFFDYNDAVMTNTTICTVIDTATGIDDLKNPVTAVYPNPASNFIAFDSSVQLQSSSILITDAYGRIVSTKKISSNAFDVSRLSHGVYFVKIIAQDGSTRVFRFIKG